MAGKPLIIKLGVSDQEVVERALRQLGAEGEKALGRINNAAKAAAKETGGAFAGMDAATQKFGAGLGRVAGLVGIFTAGLSLSGLVAWTKSTIDAVGGLGEMAEQLGVTTQGLQAYRAAAAGAGASAQELDIGLAQLTNKIGEAAGGADDAIKAFNGLKVGVLDAGKNVRSTEAVLVDIAEALQGVDSEAKKAAVAKDLFGKSGQKLLPVLRELAEGNDSLKKKYRELGLVVSDELIERFDKASDDIAAAGMKITVAFANFIGRLKIDEGIVEILDRITRAFEPTPAVDQANADRLAKLAELQTAYTALGDTVSRLGLAEEHLANLRANSNGEATVAIERTQLQIEKLKAEADGRLEVAQAIGEQLKALGQLYQSLQARAEDFEFFPGIPVPTQPRPAGGNTNPTGTGQAKARAAEAEKLAQSLAREAQAYRDLERAIGEQLVTARSSADEAEFKNRVTELEIANTDDARDAIYQLTLERTRAAGAIERQRVETTESAKAQKLEAEAADLNRQKQGELAAERGRQAAAIREGLPALLAEIDRKNEAALRAVSLGEASRVSRDITRVAEDMSSGMTDFITDTWFAFRIEGIKSFDDVWDAGLKGAERFLVGVLAKIAEQAIVMPVSMAVVGAAPGLFGISGAASGAAAGGGIIGDALSGIGGAIGGIGDFLGISQLFNTGGGGAVLGAAGMPAGMLGDLAGSGGMLSGLGGAVPYIGAGLAVAGILAGALFKKKPSVGPGQAATLQQGALELELLRAAADNGGSASTAAQYGRGAISGFADLFDAIGGGRFTTGTGFNIGNNQKEGFSYALYAPGQAAGSYDNTTEAKNLASAEEAITQAFLAAVNAGLVEGLSDNFKAAFAAVAPETTEALEDIVARVAQYEAAVKPALDMLDPANSGLGQALKASADAFAALTESATELGLAIDPLAAKAAEAAQAIRDGFVKDLETQARAASGQGFLNALIGASDSAGALAMSNAAGFASDPAALARNQDLINTIFAGNVDQALAGLDVEQLQQVVAFFGDAADSTGVYITAVAQHLIALGGAAEEAAGGLTTQGQGLLDQLGIRELRLGGQDREALLAQGALDKAAALSHALAEGFNPEQLGRLALVIDGELNAALEAFDQAATDAAAAALAAAEAEAARAQQLLRDSRDFDASLAIREARVGGNDRGALVLELAAQRTAEIEAAEAAGRTAEQIARLALVLDAEAVQALKDFDDALIDVGGPGGSLEDATDALRAFNEDLQVRASALTGDELATALLQFDIDAARQREEAAAIAGADLAALEQVLAGERAKIISDYNDRLAEEAARAAEDAQREAERLAEAQARAAEEAARAAEEAAQRIADAFKEAARVMEDFQVRDLRADGLDREADILAKQLSNAQELAKIDELIAAGATNLDRGFAKRVLDKELQAIIKGTAGGASGARGFGYDPQAYDRFFTVAASGALVGANQNLRDQDFLRTIRQVDIATSNVIPFPGGGAAGGDGTAPGPVDYDSLRQFGNATFAEVEGLFTVHIANPLGRLHDDLVEAIGVLREIRDLAKSGANVNVNFGRVPSRPAVADPGEERGRPGRRYGQGMGGMSRLAGR